MNDNDVSLSSNSRLEIEWIDGFYKFYNISQIEDIHLLCYGSMESEQIGKLIYSSVPWLNGLKDLCMLIGSFCGGNDTNGVKTLIDRYQSEIQNLIEDGH